MIFELKNYNCDNPSKRGGGFEDYFRAEVAERADKHY